MSWLRTRHPLQPTPPDAPVVVVLDDGVDLEHPELKDALWTNPGEIAGDGLDNDGDGVVDDVHGFNVATGSGNPTGSTEDHGTALAGIIAAADDGVGNTGVAAGKARLLTIGGYYDGDPKGIDTLEKAVDYIVRLKRDHGVNIRVVNASFGDEFTDPTEAARMHAAIQRLADADILLVAAAGNDSLDIDDIPRLPATDDSPNVLTVAALDFAQDGLGLYSAWGRRTVELCAPGTSILTTRPDGTYGWATGTSIAAPEVAGAAALLFAENPQLTAVQARQILMDTVHKLPTLDGLVSTGGTLDVAAAVARASS